MEWILFVAEMMLFHNDSYYFWKMRIKHKETQKQLEAFEKGGET
jgi:hypothetical protein